MKYSQGHLKKVVVRYYYYYYYYSCHNYTTIWQLLIRWWSRFLCPVTVFVLIKEVSVCIPSSEGHYLHC